MILKQIFRTYEGARKRTNFENAHSDTHVFFMVRFLNDKEDLNAFDSTLFKNYTWRIRKEKKK